MGPVMDAGRDALERAALEHLTRSQMAALIARYAVTIQTVGAVFRAQNLTLRCLPETTDKQRQILDDFHALMVRRIASIEGVTPEVANDR